MLRPLRSPKVDFSPAVVPPVAAPVVAPPVAQVSPAVIPIRQGFELPHHAASSPAFFALLRRTQLNINCDAR